MTDPLAVRQGEKGLVRLFALDMSPEQARFMRDEPGAAAQVLGVADLDPEQVDIFAVADLEELGLDGWLAEGCGIPEDRIAPDRDRLRAVTGWVMAIRSRAFGGASMRLAPAGIIRLIGVYAEPGTDWTAGRIETDSARPGTAPGRAPRAARARAQRAGAAVFTVVMLVIAAIVLLVAT